MMMFLVTFAVMSLVVLAMAVGAIVAGKRIQGSCGGLGEVGVERVCDCPDPCERRRQRDARAARRWIVPTE